MTAQVWASAEQGSYLYADELSKVLRTENQPKQKFRQFCDFHDPLESGNYKQLHRGQLFHWDIVTDVAAQGGQLVETSTIPETNFTVLQGTLTINEFGHSVPYTGLLDDLSFFPVKQIIKKALSHDAAKAFDIQAWNQFDQTALRVNAVAGTASDAVTLNTNGTCSTTNTIALGIDHVRAIVDVMKERDIPGFLNDDYFCISHPTTFRPFRNALEDVYQHTAEGFQRLVNGLIGRYEGVQFIEQNFIPKGGAADSTTFDPDTRTADAWDQGLSSWAMFFGGDTVAEAIVIPEEIRGKIVTDFGRSKAVAWYYLGGFGLIHTASMDSARNSRIVKWDSAV